jgi:Mrp family chromosome partitioning ATPase
LVARPNYTQENMLGEAIDQLLEAELGLVGVIINGADISIALPPSDESSSGEDVGITDEATEISVGANHNY